MVLWDCAVGVPGQVQMGVTPRYLSPDQVQWGRGYPKVSTPWPGLTGRYPKIPNPWPRYLPPGQIWQGYPNVLTLPDQGTYHPPQPGLMGGRGIWRYLPPWPRYQPSQPGLTGSTPRYLPLRPRYLPPLPKPGLMRAGVSEGTYLPGQGTNPPGTGHHMEYLIRSSRYASCVHAGGLSCLFYIHFGLQNQ